MLQPQSNTSTLDTQTTPAFEAATLLLRIGMGLLCIVVPFAAFFSRRSLVVLVPIALTMLVLANTIVSEDFSILRRLKLTLSRVAGLAFFTLALWSVASLAWTPFPAEASEHLFKALGTVILGFAACMSLPLKMRAPNLHLVTLGALTSTLLSLGVAANVFWKLNLLPLDSSNLARALILLSFLIWPAIAWLTMRKAPFQASFLLVLCIGGISLNHSNIVSITFAIGFAIFILAIILPKLTAWLLSLSVCVAVLGVPLLALALKNTSFQNTNLTALRAWGAIIETNPLRLLTGIGFEGATKTRIVALNNPIIDLWIDFGLIGAVAIAAFFANILMRCLRLPQAMIAPMMATIISVSTFAYITNTVLQIWFLSSLAVIAIAFMAVKNGEHRMVRPKPQHH